MWAFLAGLVGARFWYAALHPAIYQEDPWLLLSLRPDALAYVPGLTLGLGCLILLLRKKSVPIAAMADAIATGSAVALAILAVRDYLVGIGYGVPLQLLWAPDMEGLRHPVQLYEATLLSLLAVSLWFMLPARPAQVFWRFVLGYSLISLFVEAFRGDAWLLIDGIRGAQVVALTGALTAIYVLSFYTRASGDPPLRPASEEPQTS